MKKQISGILIVVFLFLLVACGQSGVSNAPQETIAVHETEHTAHSYRNGECSVCGASWTSEYVIKMVSLNGTTFLFGSSGYQDIGWSHSDSYINARGSITIGNVKGEIGSFVISANGNSCSYKVYLGVSSSGKANISLIYESGNETTMGLIFNNYSSVLRSCETQLAESFNMLKQRLYSEFDYNLF